MLETITIVYLVFMFIALYFFSFFIILTIRNRKDLFSHPEPKTDFKVSVIIPVYNEEESVEDTVKHVMELEYPKKNLEVIVVNDGSKDRTGEIVGRLVKKYSNLKLINKENSGKADSVNVGIKNSSGELVAVADADSFPDPDSLKKLTGFFRDEKMGAVTSFVRLRNRKGCLSARIQSIEYLIMGWNRKLLDFVDSVYVTNGPLSLYRKKYVEEVGGFDPKSITEDIDITWNLLYHGYKTGMALDANVSTVAPLKFKPWFRQRTRWGLGGLQAIFKYKGMFFRKGMFGAFVLPFVSFSIILSIATFLFSSYLILRVIFIRLLSTSYSLTVQTTVLTFRDINLYPSVILFYFAVLFILSTCYTLYVLKKTKFEANLNVQKFFFIIFYSVVYLTLYPIVWFASIYRFVKGGKHKW